MLLKAIIFSLLWLSAEFAFALDDSGSKTNKACRRRESHASSTTLSSMSSTSTTTTTPSITAGPTTVTVNNNPFLYTKWNPWNGEAVACESSTIVGESGFEVTECAGSSTTLAKPVSSTVTINISPNSAINYGNWTNFYDASWYEDTQADRTSQLFSGFSSALSTLCYNQSGSTVLSVTTTSFDWRAATMAFIPTTTTMAMCAAGTATAENVRFIADNQSDDAKLEVSVPFSYFDPNDLQLWINLTSLTLAVSAMSSTNTFEANWLEFEGRGPGQKGSILEHKGPSAVDLTFFSSDDVNMVLQRLQVAVSFHLDQSSFDCSIIDALASIADFFFPEVIPESIDLVALCEFIKDSSQ